MERLSGTEINDMLNEPSTSVVRKWIDAKDAEIDRLKRELDEAEFAADNNLNHFTRLNEAFGKAQESYQRDRREWQEKIRVLRSEVLAAFGRAEAAEGALADLLAVSEDTEPLTAKAVWLRAEAIITKCS